MQFPNIDDEDEDFGLSNTTRSRLSSLFQAERNSGDVNQALIFTAPKQPKKNDISQSSQGTLKLIHSAAVHAYKLIDGNYTTQGKLGCAILGLHETGDYKLLLYKGKQAQVSICNIFPNFKFHVLPNNYATFYDDKKENWSINFDSESALITFAKQVALSKANAQDKSQTSLVIQDLSKGDGPTLDIGDAAEVKYTGWLLRNHSLGQVFDSNMQSESAFRLRLGKKVIKGWSEGLVGAQKGTKRFLIVPPLLAYGAEGMGNAVPPNSTLIFEISIVKIKKSRDSSHSPGPTKVSETIPDKKPEVLTRHSITSDDNIRLRGASISEQLSQSPKKDKAQLISRMAKMGTATLPFQGAIPVQASSGSESEEETLREKSSPPVQITGSRTSSPKLSSKPASRKNSDQLIAQPLQLQSVQETSPYHVSQPPSSVSFYPSAVLSNQPYVTPTNPYPAFQPQIPAQYQMPQIQYAPHTMPGVVPHVPSLVDTQIPMLITESRSQNTEVRLSLSKVTEKVDTVIQKINELNVNQGRTRAVSHSSLMDSAMLVQSIEKIVQENSQLKEDCEVKNSKIQTLNEKICDLLQRNQRFFEESNNILEQRSDTLQAASAESQAKLITLQQEKSNISSELSETLSKLTSMESDIENHKSQENELVQKLQEQQKHIEELEFQLSNLSNKADSELINSFQNEMKVLCEEKTLLHRQLKNWEEKWDTLNKEFSVKTKELQELQKQLKMKNVVEKNTSNSAEKIEAMKKEIETIQAEKKDIILKFEDLQTKLSDSTKSECLLKNKLSLLQTELQNALVWKEKYEVFYQKARQWKEESENERQKLLAQLKQNHISNTSSPEFSGEIKKVMNILYKVLQGKFEPQSSYSGNDVLGATLLAIRGLTFQMLQKKELRADSLTKDSNSATSVESNTVNSETNSTEIVPIENAPLKNDDNSPEKAVETSLQENGILEDFSSASIDDQPVSDVLCNSVKEMSKKDTFFEPEEIGDFTVNNATNDNCIDNRVKSSETLIPDSNEIEKQPETLKNDTDKCVVAQPNRVSPDHSEQLSSDNTSGHSLSGTPKV